MLVSSTRAARWLTVMSLLACAATFAKQLRMNGPPVVTVSGVVLGASRKHAVYVALWDNDGFLKRPVQQVRLEPGLELMFQFQMPAGRWALSAFEDENDNGTLDMGLFGPREPSGFWHSFHAWRKPRFGDVSSLIEQDTTNANIRLRK